MRKISAIENDDGTFLVTISEENATLSEINIPRAAVQITVLNTVNGEGEIMSLVVTE